MLVEKKREIERERERERERVFALLFDEGNGD